MTALLNNIKIGLLIAVGVPIVLGIAILLSPFMLFISIQGYFYNRTFTKEYSEYLLKIEGTKFFCYNNRTNSQDFIEKNIIPTLSPDINVIFLDGKTPKSDYQQKFISKALYSIKDRKGFPYLLKVSNGQLFDKSINNDFYNTLRQNKDIGQLTEKINSFFQITQS